MYSCTYRQTVTLLKPNNCYFFLLFLILMPILTNAYERHNFHNTRILRGISLSERATMAWM